MNANWHGAKWAIINSCQPRPTLLSLAHTIWLHSSDWTVCPHPCVQTHIYKHIQTHCLLYFLRWAVWLASSPATVPKGQRWPPLGSTSYMSFRSGVCMCVRACVCVSVCCQRDSVTSLIKFPLLEILSMCIYSIIYTAFIAYTVSPSSSSCQQISSFSAVSIPFFKPPPLPTHLPPSSYFLPPTLPLSSWHRLTGLSHLDCSHFPVRHILCGRSGPWVQLYMCTTKLGATLSTVYECMRKSECCLEITLAWNIWFHSLQY